MAGISRGRWRSFADLEVGNEAAIEKSSGTGDDTFQPTGLKVLCRKARALWMTAGGVAAGRGRCQLKMGAVKPLRRAHVSAVIVLCRAAVVRFADRAQMMLHDTGADEVTGEHPGWRGKEEDRQQDCTCALPSHAIIITLFLQPRSTMPDQLETRVSAMIALRSSSWCRMRRLIR